MRKAISAVSIALFLVAFGCKKESTETSAYNAPSSGSTTVAKANLTPEELGELGAKIKKNPKEADRILADKGLNQQQFEQAVRKVAESPDDSKRYAAAYKKAS